MNFLVIFKLMFVCVFMVELFMCGVKIMFGILCSGEMNFLLLVFGFFGNMLIVVLVIWFDFKVFVKFLIMIYVLCVVLMKIVFFFICVNFFLVMKLCVDGILGICKEIILVLVKSLFKLLIWCVLFNGSFVIVLK